MPMTEYDFDADQFTQECAACTNQRNVQCADISLGDSLSETSPTNPHAIRLPPCAYCGAQETLMRTFDTLPDHVIGSRFDRHRKAVHALAAHLHETGRVHANLGSYVESPHPTAPRAMTGINDSPSGAVLSDPPTPINGIP